MNTFFAYVRLIIALGSLLLFSTQAPALFSVFEHAHEAQLLLTFFSVALIFVLSFSIFYLTEGTKLPSFVIAIFFGMAAKPFFAPVIHNETALAVLVGFGATLILFGGGLETPFSNFKTLFWKIIALSFPGLLLTAILFSFGVQGFSSVAGMSISAGAAVLLGAVLASTDPAAIIPVLKKLRFKKRATKDIVISESAMTDVTGTLLTVMILSALTAGAFATVSEGYASVFTIDAALVLAKQLVFGGLFGLAGYGLLALMHRFKLGHTREFEVDSAFFLFIPVIMFTVALALGGSGYFAAFIAGLLFSISEPLHETERFFNHIIDGFFKPVIFLLLGALCDISEMLDFALIGILSALAFMFIIRPLVVWIVVGPFILFGRQKLTWREIFFISFVRETGAIPAVLLVTIVSMGIGGLEGLVPIGMWVILLTLIIEPPLTPLVAKTLRVAEPIEDTSELAILHEPFVVLGTRGLTWKRRLNEVTQWSKKHHVKHIMVLLCLEYEYSEERVEEIREAAQKKFEALNRKLRERKEAPVNFIFVARKGFLQKNVEEMARTRPKVSAVFVGKKMLDYRLRDVKDLGAPIYFMD